MKITRVKLTRLCRPLEPAFAAAWDPVSRSMFEATLVTVETDEGVCGYGSGDTMDGFENFDHLFVGKDPLRILHHVRTLETITFHAGKYWPLEAALWDIVGKVTEQPVALHFGGALERIPAYASFGELKDPAAYVETVLGAMEHGFKAVKIRMARDRIEQGVQAVAAIREAAGEDIDIMVDLNQMWRTSGDIAPALDLMSVRQVACRLRELGVLWLEEPLAPTDIVGARMVRAQTGMRIAGGEMVRSLAELAQLVDQDAFDIYQPDVVLSVGLHRTRFIAELAQLHNRFFTPHTWSNGLGLLANLHVVAGVGGGPYIEFPYDPPGWTPARRDFFLADTLDIESDGCLAVPSCPGLGAVVDFDAIAYYEV
ncbi:mandelate racemase/muconate lactonizing enzyme family protein [Streptomyces formicae]|uniref:Mandelate racemase/muconate lactonizing enzyme family protein n=1 Tax=Streptomyces formicae TaxID=1616117 RepID=A0ABY3WI36_9ACTN|nr:mandelate racemase/muconate lactonizing enzyme family protein [Streptomyces formicae]UNM12259.1 mandelate racemase/muconate lactonizing enzyme family protein [Streptomyces formicae]